MADEQNNSDDRIEKMLRRWGADEAARAHGTSPALLAHVARRHWARQWLPAAVAAVLAVAAGVMFVSAGGRRSAPVAIKAPSAESELRQRLADRDAAIARAAADLKQAREGRLNSDGLRIAAEAAHRTRVEAMRQQIEAGRVKLAAATKRLGELATIAAQRDAQAAELARLRKDKADRDKELARLFLARSESAAALADRDARIAALELDKKRLSESLAALRQVRLTDRADLRGAYFAAAAPGLTGALARQVAARRTGMLRRCQTLRRSITDESSGRLLDRLEVVLTRLEMMDASDVSQSEALAAMVSSGRIEERIARAVDCGRQAPPLRQWLIEAQMILAGKEIGGTNVG